MFQNFSQEEIHRIISNPFHCLPKVNDSFVKGHQPSIDEKQWINTNAKLIDQIGTKKWLGLLLENLKSEAVPEETYSKVMSLNI
ncbi:MAG TPA: hypothetical protein VL098_05895 [Flavipsychrobacter sp.]|nr:hypothetical protein [Flavipsychrobacter sp.]